MKDEDVKIRFFKDGEEREDPGGYDEGSGQLAKGFGPHTTIKHYDCGCVDRDGDFLKCGIHKATAKDQMNQKNFKDHVEDSGIKPKQINGEWMLSCVINEAEYRYMMPYASKRALVVAQYSMMRMYDSPIKVINSPFWEKV